MTALDSEQQRQAIQLLRAWVAGCGDERFSSKEQVRELLEVSGKFLSNWPMAEKVKP